MVVETKYSIGDTVWVMQNNKTYKTKVESVSYTFEVISKIGKIGYVLNGCGDGEYDENEVYASKNELLESL